MKKMIIGALAWFFLGLLTTIILVYFAEPNGDNFLNLVVGYATGTLWTLGFLTLMRGDNK